MTRSPGLKELPGSASATVPATSPPGTWQAHSSIVREARWRLETIAAGLYGRCRGGSCTGTSRAQQPSHLWEGYKQPWEVPPPDLQTSWKSNCCLPVRQLMQWLLGPPQPPTQLQPGQAIHCLGSGRWSDRSMRALKSMGLTLVAATLTSTSPGGRRGTGWPSTSLSTCGQAMVGGKLFHAC